MTRTVSLEAKGKTEKIQTAEEQVKLCKTHCSEEEGGNYMKEVYETQEGGGKYLKGFGSIRNHGEDMDEMLINKKNLQVCDITMCFHDMKTDQKVRTGALVCDDSQVISMPKVLTVVTKLFSKINEKIAAGICYPLDTCWLKVPEISALGSDYVERRGFDLKGVNSSETLQHCKNCTIAGKTPMIFDKRGSNQKPLEYSSGMRKKLTQSDHTRYGKSLNIFLSKEIGEGEVLKNMLSDNTMNMQPADVDAEIQNCDEGDVEMVFLGNTSTLRVLMLRSVSPGRVERIIEKIHIYRMQGAKGNTPVHGQIDDLITSPEPSTPILVREKDHQYHSTPPFPKSHDGHYGFDFIGIDNIAPKSCDPKRKNGDHRKDLRTNPKENLLLINWESVHPPQCDAGFQKAGAGNLFPVGLSDSRPVDPLYQVDELSSPSPEGPSGAGVERFSGAGVEDSSDAGAEGLSDQAVGASSHLEDLSSTSAGGFTRGHIHPRDDPACEYAKEGAGYGDHERTGDETVSKETGSYERVGESDFLDHDVEPDCGSPSPQHPSSPFAQATEARLTMDSPLRSPVQISSQTGPQHIYHAYPEQCESQPDSHNLGAAQSGESGRSCPSILPSGMPQRGSGLPQECSERWGSRPVQAHQRFHFVAQPIADGRPLTAEETISFSFSPQETFHAPVRPSGTVHAAGSLPPWATTVARIDLSVAANRSFVQLRTRLGTYDQEWPDTSSDNDRANMALAGFYRPGQGRRRVRCFYCGLELDIASHHNIWDEHVRYRPTCAYLRSIVGSDFVTEAQIRLARESDS